MTAGVAAALADARDAKDAFVNPTAAPTTAADKAIEAAEKALEKAADKADGGPVAANAAARKAASDMRLASCYDLDVSATVETQTGVTFALGFDMGAGQIVDYDDDKIEVARCNNRRCKRICNIRWMDTNS